jgi:two-component system copper resistance phosphate regulon response regulator CusR
MRIFSAEDEAAIAGFLKEGLEEEGFAVDLATNGRDALEMWKMHENCPPSAG